jgi:hypothetical protein
MNLTEGFNISPLELFKALLGFTLIFMGMIISVLLLYQVYQFFLAPQQLATFRQLLPVAAPISFRNEQTSFAIPTEIVIYIIPLLLLQIPIRIASMLIGLGIKLLQKPAEVLK